MSAAPPPSPLITPDARRRLQQQYEQAQRLLTQPRPGFRRIHELVAACVRADPGNILYLEAMLANLKKREAAKRRSWWHKVVHAWARGANRQEQVITAPFPAADDGYSALAGAGEALWNQPNDPNLLRGLATAAAACDFDEIELRYLEAAREAAPDDVETLRMLARALTRQGRFDDATGPWFAVLALAPDDAEAEQAIEDIQGTAGQPAPPPEFRQCSALERAETLVVQARALQDAGKFSEAEECFARAQAALGGDLALLHEREELRLMRSERRLAIARRRTANDAHPKAQSLVQCLEDEHNRLEIDILNIRAERLPNDAALRVELARRLKRAGNFSGAIQRLEEAQRLMPNQPETLVELGECWQHLRQFDKALDYYRQAVRAEEAADSEAITLARYRVAVLASAMGRIDEARQQLAAVVSTAPDFKDARERLDKLGAN
jgi:tetratricopeptide (TPR) repeat protein